jgi:hypothetical protein
MANAQEWYTRATDLGVRTQGWFDVKMGSVEDKAWREYFARLGWTPRWMRNVEQTKARSYTMPVQWPAWLPVGFDEPDRSSFRPRVVA